MEGQDHPSPSHVVIAFDATKDRYEGELKLTLNGVRMRGDILRGGGTLLVLGVLNKVPHPMGYQTKACPDSFAGTSYRAMEEEVSKKVDVYVNMLLQSAEEYGDGRVKIEVKITAGTPTKKVILQEVIACKATWVILDRHLRRDLRFYLKQIPCKVAFIQDSLSVEVLRSCTTNETDVAEHKMFYSMSKPVPVPYPKNIDIEQSSISCRSFSAFLSSLESFNASKNNLLSSSSYLPREHRFSLHDESESSSMKKNSGINATGKDKCTNSFQQRSLEAPILCVACGTRTELYINDSARFNLSEIQLATDDFSKNNLVGEGGYGHVYKGKLRHGQLIAAKVRKEASTQGFAEFHAEVYVLGFARHKNIIMLLGYCCKENLNILVYEYICNKSLEWHLFDKTATVLEWHQRRAIAIGTAKGLRFLHEECRGGPIIHRDMRPSNILLTHDFVPMLGDFGLAKWKMSEDPEHTRILGTLGYLAPEYIEDGIVSVRTDVYAFGITLLQLISGRNVIDAKREEGQQYLVQWAKPLIETLALHELTDPRIGNSYDTYELYLMAKAAYLCVQSLPELRPSMREVVRLLEGESDQFRRLMDQFVPHYTK